VTLYNVQVQQLFLTFTVRLYFLEGRREVANSNVPHVSVQIYALLHPVISVGYRTAYFINFMKHSLLEFFNIYMCGGINIRGSFCKMAARYEFLKEMVKQNQVFWSVIPRRLVNSYRLFGELSYLHLQGEVVVSLKLQAISPPKRQ